MPVFLFPTLQNYCKLRKLRPIIISIPLVFISEAIFLAICNKFKVIV